MADGFGGMMALIFSNALLGMVLVLIFLCLFLRPAFLLVIGIIVDDAIVVGESIHLHVENGVAGQRGAIAGANMVAKPVFFAVLTTMLVLTCRSVLYFAGSPEPFTTR